MNGYCNQHCVKIRDSLLEELVIDSFHEFPHFQPWLCNPLTQFQTLYEPLKQR